MAIIDISPPVSPRIAVWPGDKPYEQSFALRIEEGSHLDLANRLQCLQC